MAKWKTCLFDLDGTLIDTIDDLAAATEPVLLEFGFGNADKTPRYTREEYYRFVGNGAKKLVERALGEFCTPDLLEKAYARFLELYDANCKVKTYPYDGILPLLDELKVRGVTLGVVTNKPEKQARYLANAFFEKYDLKCVYGSIDERPKKPDPTAVYMAINDCNADPETTLFIGDSDVAILTAHTSGLVGVGAAWGFRGEEELRRAGADILLQHPLDLLRYF